MTEREIFIEALQKATAGERSAYLDAACGADRELRGRVEQLLAEHEKEGSFLLDSPPAGFAATVVTPPIAETPGMVIGPYKLLEQIGEGGFGVVFMADQQAPVRRRVALKIIKPGMDTRQVLARFKAELQALSLMDHPNIARVLDAGSTDSGRPYFVMELVRGVPITDYCDQNNLPVHERLDLFVQVCHAVQHAHQKGIIHRDIKPSNVLVTLHDGRPVPKVIDFGVAKAIDRQLTEETLFTRFAEMIGTPLYMSPEQAEMTGLDIDTRADIYSLGVLLYELLTGNTPFDKDRLRRAAFDEIRRIIREEEPPKPSTRISTLGDTRAAVAAHRHADPHRLSQLVRGDLDWIVMKALEKDRTRRYETASNFAADVLRYLSHRPVEASPPSSVYRFRKFARRNRVAITTVAVVLIALLLGTMVSATQAIRAKRAEQLAEDRLQKETEAHEQAEANFQRARAAVDEFFTVVSQNKLLDVPGLQPLRKDLLEAASRYYRALAQGRDDDPSVRAGLAVAQLRLAEVYYEVDRNNDAIAAVNAGLDLVEQLLHEYPGNFKLFRKLGGFWKGTRWTSGVGPAPDDPAAAERTLNKFIHIWEKLAAEDPEEPAFQSDLATVYDRGGQLLDLSARHGEAAACFQRAIGLWERLAHAYPNQPEYQAALGEEYQQMARQAAFAGKRIEQVKWRDQALALREKLVASYPSVPHYRGELADSLVSKAAALAGEGKTKEAEALCRRALESMQKLAAEYPNAQITRAQLAKTYGVLKQWDKAIAGWSKVIELKPDASDAFNNRGNSYNALKQWDKAIADYSKAIELDPKNVAVLRHRASCYGSLKQWDKAIADCTKAIELEPKNAGVWWQRAFSHELMKQWDKALADFTKAIELDPKNVALLRQRASCYGSLKQCDKAIADYTKAVELDPKNVAVLRHRASCYGSLKQWDKAIADCTKAIELEPKNAGVWWQRAFSHELMKQWDKALADFTKAIELDPKNVALLRQRASCYGSLKQCDKAIADYTKAVELDPKSVWPLFDRANLYRELKQWDRAIADYSKAIELEPKNAWALSNRANVYSQLKQWDKALADYTKAIELNPKNAWALGNRANIYSQLKQWDKAIGDHARVLELEPKNVWALSNRANVYSQLKQWDKAIGDHARILELDPKNAWALSNRANIYSQLKQWDKALADFTKAIELNPKNAWALSNRANIYSQLKQWDKAIGDYARILELDPKNADANNSLAWFLSTSAETRLRDPSRAVELAQKAVELAPAQGMFWNTLGVAHYRVADWKAATAALKKSDELLKGNDLSFNAFFLAMARWQLGNKDEGRKWYDQAVEWMEKSKPQDDELRRFRAEAAELLGLNKTPAPKTQQKEAKLAK